MKNNNIFKRSLLGLFVLFMVLAPLSISLNSSTTGVSIGIPPHWSLAQADEHTVEEDGSWGIFDIGKKTIDLVGNSIGIGFMNVAAGITATAGKLLDYTLEELVFGMGEKLNGTFGNTIDVVWKLIRDICNLAFIFGFIYIGIRTIIDPESADTKRFLSRIIIGALLINFSLFFVKVIIDFSNFTAMEIYGTMTTGTGSLTETITESLGIVTFYNAVDGTFKKLFEDTTMWFFILGTIFLLITAFIFFATAILLITRFVTLIFIMVASPMLFAATVFPQTEHYASDLWRKLISNAFFAPAYLLLTLISITLIHGLDVGDAGAGFTSLLDSSTSKNGMSTMLQFAVVTFFMISSLLIAQKMGVKGGDVAISLGNKLRNKGQAFAGAATLGLGARALRATAGRYAHNKADDNATGSLKDRAATSWSARQKLKLARVVGDASFDARNTGVTGKVLGEGRKGGYKTVLDEVKKKEEEFAKSLGEVDDDDVRVTARKKEMEHKEKELRHLQEKLKVEKDIGERKKLSDEIDHKKHDIHDAKVEYETEKQRRIVGSTYAMPTNKADIDTLTTQKDAIKKLKDKISDEWNAYTANGKEDPVKREEIGKLMKDLKDQKKAHDAFKLEKTDRGYAGVRESAVWWNTWPTGRMVTHEREAGKAVRKARKDGLPKEKDSHHDNHGGGGGHAKHHEEAHDDEQPPESAPGLIYVPSNVGGGARKKDDHGHAPVAHKTPH